MLMASLIIYYENIVLIYDGFDYFYTIITFIFSSAILLIGREGRVVFLLLVAHKCALE